MWAESRIWCGAVRFRGRSRSTAWSVPRLAYASITGSLSGTATVRRRGGCLAVLLCPTTFSPSWMPGPDRRQVDHVLGVEPDSLFVSLRRVAVSQVGHGVANPRRGAGHEGNLVSQLSMSSPSLRNRCCYNHGHGGLEPCVVDPAVACPLCRPDPDAGHSRLIRAGVQSSRRAGTRRAPPSQLLEQVPRPFSALLSRCRIMAVSLVEPDHARALVAASACCRHSSLPSLSLIEDETPLGRNSQVVTDAVGVSARGTRQPLYP